MDNNSPNQYADDSRTWNTNVALPDEVIDAYMDMQARVFAANEQKPSFNKARFSQTREEMQQAYSAGYEQADRCQAKFGTMVFNKYNLLGVRSTTGIAFATGVASNAFSAGFQARQNA